MAECAETLRMADFSISLSIQGLPKVFCHTLDGNFRMSGEMPAGVFFGVARAMDFARAREAVVNFVAAMYGRFTLVGGGS